MTDKEFYDWFVPRAEQFAEMGIMHPRSEWGKIVKICLMANKYFLDEMKKEIIEDIKLEMKKDITIKSETVKHVKPKKDKIQPEKPKSSWIITNNK